MASKIAEAYLQLRASLDQFAADLQAGKNLAGTGTEAAAREMNEKMKKGHGDLSKTTHGAFADIAAQARNLAVILATTLGGAKLVGAARDMELAQVELETTLQATGMAAGWTAKQLEQMGESAGLTGMFGKTQTIQAMQAMLQYRDVQGETFKQAIAAAGGLAAVTGGDLKRSAAELGAALQEPAHGLDKLASMGILVTAIERRIMDQLMATNQVWRAQQMILDKMTHAGFKDWAKQVSGTFAGAMMQLRASLMDLASAIGRFFAPILQPIMSIISGISKTLMESEAVWTGWANEIKEAFGDIWKAVRPAADAIGEAFTGALKGAGDAIVWAVKTVAGLIVTHKVFINDLIMAMGIYIGYRIAVIALTSAMGLLKVAFYAFMGEVSAIVFKLAASSEAWKEWWNQIQDIFNGLAKDAAWAFQMMEYSFSGKQSDMVKTAEDAWKYIMGSITTALRGISSVVNDFWTNWDIGIELVKLGFQGMWMTIHDAFWNIIGAGVGAATALGSVFGDMAQNVHAIFDTLVNFIRASFVALWAGITSIFEGKNPLTAFANEWSAEMERLGKRSAQWKTIGSSAGYAYEEGFKYATRGIKFGVTDAMEVSADKIRMLMEKRNKTLKDLEEARERAEYEGLDKTLMLKKKLREGDPQGLAPREIKLQFTGLTDLWKKIQESLSGGSMIALQKAGVQAAEKNAAAAVQNGEKLDRIEKNTRQKEPAAFS